MPCRAAPPYRDGMPTRTVPAPAPAPAPTDHPTSRAVEDAFDALRALRWQLLSDDQETRVAAFYGVEDVAAELSAWVASVDIREV